jgi:hypothetical protein
MSMVRSKLRVIALSSLAVVVAGVSSLAFAAPPTPTAATAPPPIKPPAPPTVSAVPIPLPISAAPLLQTRLARPAGPEPTQIEGILRFRDPATDKLHTKVMWRRSDAGETFWAVPDMTRIGLVFKPRAGGEEVRVEIQIDLGYVVIPSEGPPTAEEQKTQAFTYRIMLGHNTARTEPPAQPPTRGPTAPDIVYNPTTWTLVAIDTSRARLNMCPPGPDCGTTDTSFKARTPNFPIAMPPRR